MEAKTAQFSGGDKAVVVAVEDLERFSDLLLGDGVLRLPDHHREELCHQSIFTLPAGQLQ